MKSGIVSDLHLHAWSVFSSTEADGVNSRLRLILNELKRAAAAITAAGGDTLVIAGDIFHVRGTLDPEVLNPVQAVIREILNCGISILAIPGNHDLKSKETTALGSAIQTLAETTPSIPGVEARFQVFNDITVWECQSGNFGFVPWRSTTEALLKDLQELKDLCRSKHDKVDVFIHAGIEGVLPNMPGSGLTDKALGAFGFRHVFAGHYHNHKVMQDGVISIGATTHHNWGDIGSKAGFLMLDRDTGDVTFHDSHAPKFIDISGKDEDEIRLLCDGNYVRFRGPTMTQSDVNELREQLRKWDALGISIEVPKATVNARAGVAKTSGQSLDQSVMTYVDNNADIPPFIDKVELKRRAADVLTRTRSVFEEA